MIDFLCLIVGGAHVNSRQVVHYLRIVALFQYILFSADIFLTLLLTTKFIPGISRKYAKDLSK
jgi:hypothetical protein